MNMPVPANQPQWQPLDLEEELIENPVVTFLYEYQVIGRTALNGGQSRKRTGYEAKSDVFMSKHTVASAMGFLIIYSGGENKRKSETAN
ncbi:MAG: hypothetical protein E6J22_03850 [Chloroflexi bacterium]|nr:MAG: hypothetical protein E6J22_03850 [Chloroflexota bacterium]